MLQKYLGILIRVSLKPISYRQFIYAKKDYEMFCFWLLFSLVEIGSF